MTQRHPGVFVTGAVFSVIGFVYLLQELDVWTISARYFFPILLIAIGVAVALTGMGHRSDRGETGSTTA